MSPSFSPALTLPKAELLSALDQKVDATVNALFVLSGRSTVIGPWSDIDAISGNDILKFIGLGPMNLCGMQLVGGQNKIIKEFKLCFLSYYFQIPIKLFSFLP
jgi:hypothetical protein